MKVHLINHLKALKTVELIVDLVEKEDQIIKTAEVMKQHHEKAKEDQYVESILAQYIGTRLTTNQNDLKILSQSRTTLVLFKRE